MNTLAKIDKPLHIYLKDDRFYLKHSFSDINNKQMRKSKKHRQNKMNERAPSMEWIRAGTRATTKLNEYTIEKKGI